MRVFDAAAASLQLSCPRPGSGACSAAMTLLPPPLPSGRKRTAWPLILGIGCGGCLLLVLAIAVAFCAFWSMTEQLPVTDADRELMVTARTLADAGYQFAPDGDGELWEKTRLFDGSIELRYEYEHPDEDAAVQISTWIELHDTEAEAALNWNASQLAMLGTWQFFDHGLEPEDRPDLLAWGSAHRTGILRRDGMEVGNYLFFRAGARNHMTVLVGICLLDPEELAALWQPRLEKLKVHDF